MLGPPIGSVCVSVFQVRVPVMVIVGMQSVGKTSLIDAGPEVKSIELKFTCGPGFFIP